jgi:hypothetical protein
MKIKTIIFWILWLGNNLAVQTVSGDDFEFVWPPLFPDGLYNEVLSCQTVGSIAPPNEQVQLATALIKWSA